MTSDGDTLLERISDDALEPAYRTAATNPQARPSGVRHSLTMGLLLALLAAWFVGAVQGARVVAGSAERERQALLTLVQQREQRLDVAEARAEDLRTQVDQLTLQALAREGEQVAQGEQLATLGIAASAAPVRGPGVLVQVDDAPADATPPDGGAGTTADTPGTVLDVDLQEVVNGLWAAGAEAVAISGQRIGPLTAIRSANDVVLVNYRSVFPPYDVAAIGDPRSLPSDFAATDGGAYLQALGSEYGIRSTITTVSGRGDDVLRLPATPVATLDDAQPPNRDEAGR
jgi:uncharacterized protein YlxW (UPF0749 family)